MSPKALPDTGMGECTRAALLGVTDERFLFPNEDRGSEPDDAAGNTETHKC